MFKIIKDPDVAAQYADANLLWWVSKQDGGEGTMLITTPVGPAKALADGSAHRYVRANSHRGIFGICVED